MVKKLIYNGEATFVICIHDITSLEYYVCTPVGVIPTLGLISNSRPSNKVQCPTQKCLKLPRIFIVRVLRPFVLDDIFYKRVGEIPSPRIEC